MREYKIVCDRQMEHNNGTIDRIESVYPIIRDEGSTIRTTPTFKDEEEARNKLDYYIKKAADFDKYTAKDLPTDKYAIKHTQTNIRIMYRDVTPWSNL